MRKRIKISLRGILVPLYCLLVACIMILPSLKYDITYSKIVLLSLPFMALYCISFKSGIKKYTILLSGMLLMFIFSFLINSTFMLSQSINFSMIAYLVFFPFFMFDYVALFRDKRQQFLCIIFTVAVYSFILISTFKQLSIDPTVARALASGDTEDEYLVYLRNNNVGGFGFSYAIGAFVPYLATKISKTRGKTRFGLIILLAILLVFTLYAQYTTLLLLSIVLCMVIFTYYSKNLFIKFFLIVLGVVILFTAPYIFRYLAQALPFESLAKHFSMMASSTFSGAEINARSGFIKQCLNLFLSHPLFGVDVTNATNAYIINHGHSTYFPLLASKGLVGTSIYFGMTFFVMKNIYRRLGRCKDILFVFAYYIILGFLNPNHLFEISIATFFLIPVIENYINMKRDMLYGE